MNGHDTRYGYGAQYRQPAGSANGYGGPHDAAHISGPSDYNGHANTSNNNMQQHQHAGYPGYYSQSGYDTAGRYPQPEQNDHFAQYGSGHQPDSRYDYAKSQYSTDSAAVQSYGRIGWGLPPHPKATMGETQSISNYDAGLSPRSQDSQHGQAIGSPSDANGGYLDPSRYAGLASHSGAYQPMQVALPPLAVNSSGFQLNDLMEQMNDIHIKHAAPLGGNSGSRRRPSDQASTDYNAYSDHSDNERPARYSPGGIISMYEGNNTPPTTLPPGPLTMPAAPPFVPYIPTSPVQNSQFDSRSYGTSNDLPQPPVPIQSTYRIAHGSGFGTPNGPRQPSIRKPHPRTNSAASSSASTSKPVYDSNMNPASPNMSNFSNYSTPSLTTSSRSTTSRPSVESNTSQGSMPLGQFSNSASTSSVTRSSTASSMSGRSYSPSRKSSRRVLPVPQEEEALLSAPALRGAQEHSRSASASLPSTSRLVDNGRSAFAQAFYAAGDPHSSPGSLSSSANAVPDPPSKHPVQTTGTERSLSQTRNTHRYQTIAGTAGPSEIARLPRPIAPPPIAHSISEPVASHSMQSYVGERARQPSQRSFASRQDANGDSRSTSASGAHVNRIDTGSHGYAEVLTRLPKRTTSRRATNDDLPQLPHLPSSPTISISPSLAESSSTSARIASGTQQPSRQKSLAPSSSSLSTDDYFGSRASRMRNRGPQRERDRNTDQSYLNPALLSNLASSLQDRLPRTEHTQSLISYPSSFTGEDVVTCLLDYLPWPFAEDRRVSLHVARSLYEQLLFHEVEWADVRLLDSASQLFCFTGEDRAAFAGLNEYDFNSNAYRRTQSPEEALPLGVVTKFTQCYSPFCGLAGTAAAGACYSPFCPNGPSPFGLQRKLSAVSLSQTNEEPPTPDAWASSVPSHLLETMSEKEKRRQGIIFEFIKGEQEYKKDLDLFEIAFHEALRTAQPSVIDGLRLNAFLTDVFANLDELRQHSDKFLNALQSRQREQSPVIQSIADIVLDACLEWRQAFVKYAGALAKGDYLVETERHRNPAFSAFVSSRREAFKIKQDFRHYHTRATIRLQRYPLLLAEYIKQTPDTHVDQEAAKEAAQIIREQCLACDTAQGNAKMAVACLQYDSLIIRDSNYSNLDLLNESRQLFQHGRMLSRPEGSLSEWSEYQVMLFDHFLTIAKPRRTGEGYRLIRKPIRLEMLEVGGFDDPPQIKSSGFHLRSVMGQNERRDNQTTASSTIQDSKVWPIVFRISGRNGGTYTLFVEGQKQDRDDRIRREWRVKLEQAIAIRQAALDLNEIFVREVLLDPDIRRAGSTAALPPNGRILCSCPFRRFCDAVVASMTNLVEYAVGPDRQPLVAFGAACGLFVAVQHDPSTLRQILQIPVTHCAVLQEFGIFLIQTEGKLVAYLIDTLVMPSRSESKNQTPPEQVSGQRDVLFFRVGRVGPRTLAVYAKKDGVNSTVLKAMEPIATNDRSRAQHSRFLGIGGKKTEWFRLYKDAVVPTEIHGLSFTRSKLALDCAVGFEILDIETMKTASFPDWTALRLDPARFDARLANIQRRCAEARAISLFRVSDGCFMFCYDTFAIFADKHGDPLAERYNDIIEWEGRPDAIVFCHPYVLAFDNRFIEIRDINDPTKIVQLIRGTGIRCCYDGQGVAPMASDGATQRESEADDRRPHVVFRDGNTERVYSLALRRR